jgi:hypothetical protein
MADATLEPAAIGLAVVSVAAALGLVLGAVAGVAPVRVVSGLVVVWVGLGSAPWQFHAGLGATRRLTLSVATGLSVSLLVPMALLRLPGWSPWGAFLPLAAAALLVHAIVLLAAGRRLWRSGGLTLLPRREAVQVVGGLAAAAVCLAAALSLRGAEPTFYGFLGTINLTWYLGLALLIGLIAITVHPAVTATLVMLTGAVLTSTPAIVYMTAHSGATAKHVAFVQEIRQTGSMSSTLAVYNDWAGFFASTAWLCDIVGVQDPFTLATWWPIVMLPLHALALYHLVTRFVADARVAWLATLLGLLADAIGADYFSPQSVGLVAALFALGLLLHTDGHRGRYVLVGALGTSLAVTHQLSPVLTSGTAVLLLVWGLVRPRRAVLLVVVPTLVWSLSHWGSAQQFVSLSAAGRVENFRPPVTQSSDGLEMFPVVGHSVVALLVCVLGIAVLGAVGLLLNRRSRAAWAAASCPVVGLVVVALNPYGQEGIFRAALFGIPWLTVLAGMCLMRVRHRDALVANAAAVLLLSNLVASLSLAAVLWNRQGDIDTFGTYYEHASVTGARPSFILVLGPGDLPTQVTQTNTNFETVGLGGIWIEPGEGAEGSPGERVEHITRNLLIRTETEADDVDLFAAWSPLSLDYGAAYGVHTTADFNGLLDAFRASPFWSIEVQSGESWLFRFDATQWEATGKG